MHTLEEKTNFGNVMVNLCLFQKSHNYQPEDFGRICDAFLWVLQGFPMEGILHAMRIYAQQHNDFPAPADLVKIINECGTEAELSHGYQSLSCKEKP